MPPRGRPRKAPEPPPDVAPDPLPDDQLTIALIDDVRVLARSTLASMPALGRMHRLLERPHAQLAVVVDVGRGRAELVAAADGERPLRARLR